MSELPPHHSNEQEHLLPFEPKDLDNLPHEHGITIDVPNSRKKTQVDIIDAEQGYSARIVDSEHTEVKIHIANPWYCIQRLPSLLTHATANMETKFDKVGNITAAMWPEHIGDALALIPHRPRPTLTIQANVNRSTGAWSNPHIYESAFTSTAAFTYEPIEPIIPQNFSQQPDSHIFSALWNTAYWTAVRKYGASATETILTNRQAKGKRLYPATEFMIGQLSELAGEILASESIRYQIPILYWNNVETMAHEHAWPHVSIHPTDENAPEIAFELPDIQKYQLIAIPPSPTTWVKKTIPFADTQVWKNSFMGLNEYARCTAPLRDLRSLISIVQWVATLQGKPPIFTTPQLNQLAQRYSEAKSQDIENKQRINTEIMKQKNVNKLQSKLSNELNKPRYWNEIIPFFADFKPEYQTAIFESISRQELAITNQSVDKFVAFNNIFLNFLHQNQLKYSFNFNGSVGTLSIITDDNTLYMTIKMKANNKKTAHKCAVQLATIQILKQQLDSAKNGSL